jgi:hypothetical protein
MRIDLEVGTVIGTRYRLERLLGEGGMGVVWAAEDLATGRYCALKLMKDAAGDPAARQRFLREGRVASAVRHPNVVGILDMIEPEGEPLAIAMELLEGESLRVRLGHAQKLPPGELAEIMVPVVSAVGAAHALAIVHRDLKPENIFLARGPAGERIVKVLDFGIAKLTTLDGEAMRSTGITTGAVLGTPAYMAPEQVFAERNLDHRADIWALGIIFYECLSGVCPTRGDNVGQVLKHVLAKPFESLDALAPEVPEELSRLVARMLAREPSQRPADLHEMIEVLAPLASAPAEPFGPPAAALMLTDGGTATNSIEVPRPPDRKRRRWRRLALVGVPLVLSGLLLAWYWPRPVSSPLDASDAKIACPIWRAEAPDLWLGAAAAATACERARVLLGGRPERTLVPAELLDLPRGSVDGIPADLYDDPGQRERSIAAARSRAQAYLDGAVTWSPRGFHVAISLHRPDGTEISHSEGDGRGLYEAVRSAMTRLIGSGLVPKASRLEPEIAAWSRTRDVDAALAMLDLRLAMSHLAGGLDAECARFADKVSGEVGELGPALRWQCAYTLGLPAPPVELDASDPSPAAVATRIRIRHFVRHVDDPGDLERLHELFDLETTSWGKSLLAATESCLAQAKDSKRAYDLALTAVRQEPKNPDGQVCDPWGQLMTMAQDNENPEGAPRAMEAWAPWNGIALLMQGQAAPTPEAALRPLRRAYQLSPFDMQVAVALADKLLAANKPEDARQIALEVKSGGYPVHSLASELILLRVEARGAKFESAIERAREAFVPSSGDAGWVRAQRFEVAWRALELAGILGRASALADEIVRRFLDPDATALDGSAIPVFPRIAAVCVLASAAVSDRCFARLAALRAQISGGITPETDEFLRGAELYAKRDLAGAAKAWRPLVKGSGALLSVLPDAMAEAFEDAGQPELAERVEEVEMLREGELHGATLGHARAAKRARDRKDWAKARALAQQVIEAWSVADEDVPAVAEMQRLLATLPPP